METGSPSILWIVPQLRYPSGHSSEARSFLRALEVHGHQPSAIELSIVDRSEKTVPVSDEELAMLVRQLERAPSDPVVAIHTYAPKPGRRYIVSAAANVARVMWETDGIPKGWAELLTDKDQVWVPSRHNYETFARGGVPESKLRVLAETTDFDVFSPGAAEPMDLGAPEGSLVFLSSFDFSERKGWRQLLLAWSRAFDANDPVCLVLKTLSVAKWDEDYIRERILHFLELQFGNGAGGQLAPVKILSTRLGTPELPQLYAAADVYVSASRGEAWGRTYMEAMAMGLPTVGARYGGNLDFMTDEDCWLVDGELVPVESHSEVLNENYRGQRWFEADVDELADALRQIASDPTAARAKASGARDRLIGDYGYAPITDRIMKLAEGVLAGAEASELREGERRVQASTRTAE
jgi:glycosyltransferase involved in cell wall biosynthesis